MASFFLLLLLAKAATGQPTASGHLAEAERLRGGGDFAAAVRLLEARLATHPDDGDAIRLLAQTLYWLQDLDRSRETYDTAIARHPSDTRLRLDYGRMLIETRQQRQARAVLAPLLGVPAARAEAQTLLGMLAYWQGDLTSARDLFGSALRADPGHEEARRQLAEIRTLTASWVRLAPALRHDDQPLDRLSIGVEAGWFATPLLPIKARVEPMRYGVAGATRTLWAAEIELSHFAPSLRLETELAGGMLRRTGPDEIDWTGRAGAGIRLPHHVTLSACVERAPYLYTIASIRTPVMTDAASGRVRWNDPRGWLGEAAFQRQSFADANAVTGRYGWLLAPLARRAAVELQAGYAFSDSNAEESRFVLARPPQPHPPGDPRFRLEGQYEPYYTPLHLVTHSAVAALKVVASPQATIRLGGSYALRATEDVPAFVVTGSAIQQVVVPGELSPWNARGSVEIAARQGLTVGFSGEVGRTSFYHWATGGVQLLYRFNVPRTD